MWHESGQAGDRTLHDLIAEYVSTPRGRRRNKRGQPIPGRLAAEPSGRRHPHRATRRRWPQPPPGM